MIRKMREQDRSVFLTLADAFYHSPAVLHPVPQSHFLDTFAQIVSGSPFTEGFLFEQGGKAAGYAILAFTYSNEAGGMVLWVEEVFLLPEYRGQGIGSDFFQFLQEEYGSRVARMRLEVEPDNEESIRLYRRMGFEPLSYLQMVKEECNTNRES